MPASRRTALRWIAAVAGAGATAGCVSLGGTNDYRLVADTVEAPSLGVRYLVEDPLSIRAQARVDFDTETKEAYLADLYDDGQVTAVEWPLVRRESWGTDTRPRPTFLRRNGPFYRVRVSSERRLERERWLFAVERTDESPPDGASVASEPFDSLSEQDRRIVDAALDAIYARSDGFLGEPDFEELRAVEYHQDLSAEASDLVPSPPFDYVEAANDHFRPITDRRVVSVPEWTYTLDPVAESREGLDAHARETIPNTRMTSGDLSDPAREVVETAVEDDRYLEDAPLSDGLEDVLEKLEIAGDLQPLEEYENRVSFREVVASYDGTWYVFDLLVDP